MLRLDFSSRHGKHITLNIDFQWIPHELWHLNNKILFRICKQINFLQIVLITFFLGHTNLSLSNIKKTKKNWTKSESKETKSVIIFEDRILRTLRLSLLKERECTIFILEWPWGKTLHAFYHCVFLGKHNSFLITDF